ncbi:MAG: thrombospondin type 3 repeat-containing protein [Candidatus Uhrbacteria bacterium]|nr:thrombospondin type 3 repeat-containing protein [Candidatus Uhrbacteria bacterium]
MGNHLSSPFDLEPANSGYVISEADQAAELLEMQTIDTDEDGLTDFDETYAYKTSPYLADSDGDGFSDSAELASGNDPNCASGDDCESVLASEDALSGINPSAGLAGTVLDSVEESNAVLAQYTDLLQQVSVVEIRQLLLSSGLSEDVVDSLSDEELMTLYQKIVTDLEDSGELEQILAEGANQ